MGQTGPPPMAPGKTYLNPGQDDQMVGLSAYRLPLCWSGCSMVSVLVCVFSSLCESASLVVEQMWKCDVESETRLLAF